MATPASKRQRVDPHALDDDTLPAKGESVLGKRHRVQDNEYYYDNQKTEPVKRYDPNQTQNENNNDNDNEMKDNENDNDVSMQSTSNNNNNNNNNTGFFGNNSNNNSFGGFNFNQYNNNGNNGNNNNNNMSVGGWKNPPIKFERGAWIDVRVSDNDEDETQWLTGIMTKDLGHQVQIHIPRQGIKILDKTSTDLAPVGTHTEGFQ